MPPSHLTDDSFRSDLLPDERTLVQQHSATAEEVRSARRVLEEAAKDLGITAITQQESEAAAQLLAAFPAARVPRTEDGGAHPLWVLLETYALLGKDTAPITRRLTETRDRAIPLLTEEENVQPQTPRLPIDARRREIVETIQRSPVTIITAETGAGKSTQVPQWLLEEGYRVVVTQPRRLAARSLAWWISKQRKEQLGGTVGFRTAQDRQDSAETRLLFCTDGLQLVRELTGRGVQGNQTVLVLDEVHEWNTNMETLVAWAKKQLRDGAEIKVVLMSATLDAQGLASYFGSDTTPAPAIDVAGKLYPVEAKERPARDLVDEVTRLAKAGRNVLVFQPGKKEIQQTIESLQRLQIDAVVLPLHGELEPAEQERVFKHYGKPKIVVSTNVAQTSITIDDIDAVVDSGLERRVETVDGVEGVYLKAISQADCTQRKGRAGRTKPGEYVLCSDHGLQSREPYPKPEIQRVRLDQTVLRLASAGFDATELDFFHQPDRTILTEAKRALVALGAMDEQGAVTQVGRQISALPVNVHVARMVIEAVKHDCVDDVLTIAACIEAGGLRDGKSEAWRSLTQETHSDLLADLDLFEAASRMKSDQLRENGIFAKAFFRAKDIRRHLADSLKRAGMRFGRGEGNGNREAILRSVVAGMVDHLYRNDYGDYRRNGDRRIKAKESVVTGRPEWVVGIPRDIEFTNKRNRRETLNLLTMCSAVDPAWLVEVAPQLVTKGRRSPQWSRDLEGVSQEEFTVFNGSEVKAERIPAEVNEDTIRCFCAALQSGAIEGPVAQEIVGHNRAVERQTEELWVRSGGQSRKVTGSDEVALYQRVLQPHGIVTRQALQVLVPATVLAEDLTFVLDEIVPLEERARIAQDNPAQITLGGITLPVRYHAEYGDRFYASTELTAEHALQLTPAECANPIPSGRELRFSITGGEYAGIQATNIEALQRAIEERRLALAWREFLKTHPQQEITVLPGQPLPPLPAPEPYDVATDALAYPAHHHSYGSWSVRWYQTEPQAAEYEASAAQAKERLDEEVRRNAERERMEADGEQILGEARDLVATLQERTKGDTETYYKVLNLSYRLPSSVRGYSDPAGIVQQVREVLGELRTIDAEMRVREALRQQEQARLGEMAEKEEVLIDFSHYHRRGGVTGNSDAWVIRPDGTLREPDVRDVPRHKHDGTYTWKLVAPEETALAWSCETKRDLLGTSAFEVRKLPVGGLTAEQQETIRRIEQEIGAEGAFSVVPPARREVQRAAMPETVPQQLDAPPRTEQLAEYEDPTDGEETRAGEGNGLFGQLLEQARTGKVARAALVGRRDDAAVAEKPVKREKKPKEKPQKQEEPAAPALPAVDTMSEADLITEYERNEQAIAQIMTDSPDIDALFTELAEAERDFQDALDKIEGAKRARDAAGSDRRKRQKALDFLAEQETRRDGLRPRLSALRTRAQQLRQTKERLDVLRARQSEIEARL